ncbi:hypothetical protein BJ165DRAFT_234808 [Panaeolus papilionaceus]|nr:hypothetical protein BJ165DRAFT_234808 [Panaeolus papilionaceus]
MHSISISSRGPLPSFCPQTPRFLYCLCHSPQPVTLKGTTPRITFKQFLPLPCAIDALLIDLQSIMNCSTDGMRLRSNPLDRIQKGSTSLGVPIPSVFHHAPLVEFLLNPQRSQEFYIDMQLFDKELTDGDQVKATPRFESRSVQRASHYVRFPDRAPTQTSRTSRSLPTSSLSHFSKPPHSPNLILPT